MGGVLDRQWGGRSWRRQEAMGGVYGGAVIDINERGSMDLVLAYAQANPPQKNPSVSQ